MKEVLRSRFVLSSAWLLMLGGLTACDPALSVAIRNRTDGPVRVSLTSIRPDQPDTTESVTMAPKGNGRRSRLFMYYGLGGWDDSTMVRVARRIRRLEIASTTDTLLCANAREVNALFHKSKKRKLFDSEMVVDVK
jgi:hypothetical protein